MNCVLLSIHEGGRGGERRGRGGGHVFINRLIPLNFLKRLHPGENEKSFPRRGGVIKTPYTRQGDLTDSFVNRGGGAPASFARLIKINGEQVRGRTRGEASSRFKAAKGLLLRRDRERAGAKKNYKNNLAEEEGGGEAVNWGGKLA